ETTTTGPGCVPLRRARTLPSASIDGSRPRTLSMSANTLARACSLKGGDGICVMATMSSTQRSWLASNEAAAARYDPLLVMDLTVASTLAAETGTVIDAAASSKMVRIMGFESLLFGERSRQPIRPKGLPKIVNPAMLDGQAKVQIMDPCARTGGIRSDHDQAPIDLLPPVHPRRILLADEAALVEADAVQFRSVAFEPEDVAKLGAAFADAETEAVFERPCCGSG